MIFHLRRKKWAFFFAVSKKFRNFARMNNNKQKYF